MWIRVDEMSFLSGGWAQLPRRGEECRHLEGARSRTAAQWGGTVEVVQAFSQDPSWAASIGVLACTAPTRRRPQDRPTTCWRDYISHLTREHLGIPQDELESVAREGIVWSTPTGPANPTTQAHISRGQWMEGFHAGSAVAAASDPKAAALFLWKPTGTTVQLFWFFSATHVQ